MEDFPRIISVDDHVIEHANVWQDRLPAKYRDVGPRVIQKRGHMNFVGGVFSYEEADDGQLGDWWVYEDKQIPQTRLSAAAGFDRDEVKVTGITYDEMRKGCWDPKARIEDMEMNHVEASLAFPSFPRFCGQTFMEANDKELSDLCVKAYNDWMVEEWCGDSDGRLIPLIIIQLWDAELAAAEVRRNADRGVHAVCFSEIPPYLDLPSIHTDYWEPFFRACEETETVICMHIGSSSKMPSTSTDAPAAVGLDAHVRQRHVVDDRLDVLRLARAPARPQARLQRGPDRLDPLHPRAGRQGLGGQPGVGRRGRQGADAAEHLLLPPDLRLLLRRRARPRQPREGRHRQHHVRDRLPALGLDLAAHPRDGQEADGPPAGRRRSTRSSAATPSRC